MSEQPPYIKLSKTLKTSGALRLLNKGKVGLIYLWCLTSQDGNGIVELDEDDIMAATGISRPAIAGMVVELEAVSLIEAVPLHQGNERQSYRLLRDFSRFGPGAPMGDGKNIFFAPKEEDVDPDPIEIPKQLLLPEPGKEKISDASQMNPFALYEAERFGKLTPLIAQTLGDWMDTLGEERVVEAMRQAVLRGKRSWPYVAAILKDWASQQQLAQDVMASTQRAGSVEGVSERPRVEPIPITVNGEERDARACWEAAYGELQLQISKDAFESWLRGARLVDVAQAGEDIEFRVVVVSVSAQQWLTHRLDTVVRRTLGRIVGQPVRVSYEVRDESAIG